MTLVPLAALLLAAPPAPTVLPYAVKAEVIHKELSPDFCWFHPRPAAIPGHGRGGGPAVVVTLQKHLAASDHFSGLYTLRTDDLGATWAGPTEIPELAWRKAPGGLTAAVIDVTPGWHAKSGRLLAIGAKTLYTDKGDIIRTGERSYETSYAALDPKTGKWTPWRELALPDTGRKFYRAGCGCSKWLARPDGTLLVPVQFQTSDTSKWRATVLHCSFDGTTLTYLGHGGELAFDGGYGFAEPSLAHFRGRYYLHLRHEAGAHVAAGGDGLHFGPTKAWAFDDGQDLGSYDTQAHFVTHADGLFLVYTRRTADNGHVFRNRAPLFVAQVDPDAGRVLRATERALFPDRGAAFGNFGTAEVTAGESWVTDAELITRLFDKDAGTKPLPRGADGSVWLGRVRWSRPNPLVK